MDDLSIQWSLKQKMYGGSERDIFTKEKISFKRLMFDNECKKFPFVDEFIES